MKKNLKIITVILLCLLTFLLQKQANATPIAIFEIIKAGIKKAIIAVDLKIQRLQNKTIWLQNAQKVLENTLSKFKLDELAGWTEKQRNLYQDYYEELAKVKSIITYYQRIKVITQKQVRLIEEYQRTWKLFRQDKHFTANELDYMTRVYSGILNETAKNIDQIFLLVNSFQTQMSDAKRMEIINQAADQIDENYNDLILFNQQNIILSIQRAKSKHDVDMIKKFYGLE